MFLQESDFNSHIYEEVRNAISRDSDTLWLKAQKAAIREAKGYLSKYNLNILFGASDDDRDEALVMRTMDLACWHFLTLSNSGTSLELFKTRYDDAIKDYFKMIQCGRLVPEGWPPAIDKQGQEKSFFTSMSSHPRRKNHF
ncbi:MAG: hypothetical protein AAGA66_08385 [Bacteroidota bacterium]